MRSRASDSGGNWVSAMPCVRPVLQAPPWGTPLRWALPWLCSWRSAQVGRAEKVPSVVQPWREKGCGRVGACLDGCPVAAAVNPRRICSKAHPLLVVCCCCFVTWPFCVHCHAAADGPLAFAASKAAAGHAEAGAGLVGLAAAVLAVEERALPRLLHLRSVGGGVGIARCEWFDGRAVETEAHDFIHAGDVPFDHNTRCPIGSSCLTRCVPQLDERALPGLHRQLLQGRRRGQRPTHRRAPACGRQPRQGHSLRQRLCLPGGMSSSLKLRLCS